MFINIFDIFKFLDSSFLFLWEEFIWRRVLTGFGFGEDDQFVDSLNFNVIRNRVFTDFERPIQAEN